MYNTVTTSNLPSRSKYVTSLTAPKVCVCVCVCFKFPEKIAQDSSVSFGTPKRLPDSKDGPWRSILSWVELLMRSDSSTVARPSP